MFDTGDTYFIALSPIRDATSTNRHLIRCIGMNAEGPYISYISSDHICIGLPQGFVVTSKLNLD